LPLEPARGRRFDLVPMPPVGQNLAEPQRQPKQGERQLRKGKVGRGS
jgi:hypothetical protein